MGKTTEAPSTLELDNQAALSAVSDNIPVAVIPDIHNNNIIKRLNRRKCKSVSMKQTNQLSVKSLSLDLHDQPCQKKHLKRVKSMSTMSSIPENSSCIYPGYKEDNMPTLRTPVSIDNGYRPATNTREISESDKSSFDISPRICNSVDISPSMCNPTGINRHNKPWPDTSHNLDTCDVNAVIRSTSDSIYSTDNTSDVHILSDSSSDQSKRTNNPDDSGTLTDSLETLRDVPITWDISNNNDDKSTRTESNDDISKQNNFICLFGWIFTIMLNLCVWIIFLIFLIWNIFYVQCFLFLNDYQFYCDYKYEICDT